MTAAAVPLHPVFEPLRALAPKRARGRPRKTEDERDDGNRRQQLLTAAARLFRDKGFDATSTRDIAAAVGMHSGSPFYHFKSKDALLLAVMEEGMRSALARQAEALLGAEAAAAEAAGAKPAVSLAVLQLRRLIRAHFDTLLGPGNDFVPVMLYEHRSLNARQRAALAQLQGAYEAAWTPVLEALHASGHLRAPVKLARLLILGALNWSVQWFDDKKSASLEELSDAAMALFLKES
ncbi:MAG: TetR/AcrR family transcriptional regulator [Gammaproteobacteria bacterium]|uniref:TetR/AcrR family transcriptional regulator n=1 Tax=Rhodoferax sp. TaxID=50421 RepID=UPI001819631A|nr:TetR/AcrR family transcriptional regulator [Rhodoferax sp.]MBU3897552.1 TetR/AcrR family transcriptional regulator [Gammaproteobacteria bacterium]MBA3058058.1 TetR/AcrR family transcriptional regulator [Rhodoferax sp.]MBU3999334.1 TetR/AcrR family transcriptional regulator [Gammaproteobacteria bacterium]MBU4018252.1 TetR/AcrR family transcriptional regulator [Gammaproteobacteria bacterium]MBU4079854.1 TetR/AcrR family transcriptional regulator [Gammaproteobacteria bacterium]